MKTLKFNFKSIMSKLNIKLISRVIILFALFLGVLSYFIAPSEWSCQNALLSIAVALAQLALGVWIVNIYLSNIEKKSFHKGYFSLILRALHKFVIHFKKLMDDEFGENGFYNFIEELRSVKFDTNKVSDDTIERCIKAVKNEHSKLIIEMGEWATTLDKLCFSGGFSNTIHLILKLALTSWIFMMI